MVCSLLTREGGETVIRFCQLTPDNDLDHLISISRDFFEEYAAHHMDFFQIDVLTAQDIHDYFSRFIGTEDGAAIIAIADREIVGYITVLLRRQASFWEVKRVGAISGLMVSRDHRRRGIATALLAQAIGFFRRRGVKYFTTYTAVANEAAVGFYERNGMAPLHTTFIGEVPQENGGQAEAPSRPTGSLPACQRLR
jgi:ribosomal protein S18 acetylase RimI-like enzyme